jgi:hypothetical protein
MALCIPGHPIMLVYGVVLLLIFLSQLFVHLSALFVVFELSVPYIDVFGFYTFHEIVYVFATLFAGK